MKSGILALFMLVAFGSSAFSQAGNGKELTRIKTSLSSFDRIKIDAQVNVVLYEGANDREATIESADNSAELINMKVINGELIVTSDNKRKNLKKKVVISIPVNNLKRIELNNDAMVVSVSTIKSDRIDVAINSECWMKLRLTGILKIVEGDGYDAGAVSYNQAAILRGYSE